MIIGVFDTHPHHHTFRQVFPAPPAPVLTGKRDLQELSIYYFSHYARKITLEFLSVKKLHFITV